MDKTPTKLTVRALFMAVQDLPPRAGWHWLKTVLSWSTPSLVNSIAPAPPETAHRSRRTRAAASRPGALRGGSVLLPVDLLEQLAAEDPLGRGVGDQQAEVDRASNRLRSRH